MFKKSLTRQDISRWQWSAADVGQELAIFSQFTVEAGRVMPCTKEQLAWSQRENDVSST